MGVFKPHLLGIYELRRPARPFVHLAGHVGPGETHKVAGGGGSLQIRRRGGVNIPIWHGVQKSK